METNRSPSIIMRVRDFSESDLLITFFTKDKGLLKGIAKGAKRSHKRFVNCLDIFCLSNLEYRLNKKGGLHFISSGKLVSAFPGLRRDFSILSLASYMIELTELLFPPELADKEMFETLRDSFDLLEKGENHDLVSIIFEITAMTLGGYKINLEKCSICGRRYSGEGAAAFKPDKGGIACLKCQQITAITPRMSPDSIKVMSRIQAEPVLNLKTIEFFRDITTEIKTVLKLHRDYHLNLRPRTACYVDGA
jgi:DNA repair protein RecO (recombination protein O)